MTPERWQEIERLYHAARERQPDERAAYLRDACEGDDALRTVVESLLARREDAAAFMEVQAGDRAAAANPDDTNGIPADAAGAPQGFLRKRPWWVWCCTLFAIVAAGGWYWVLLAGPARVGWQLRGANDGSPGRNLRVQRIYPGSAAERAGLQVNDVMTAGAVEHFVSRRDPYAPYPLEVVRRGERQTLIFTAVRTDLRYWLGAEGWPRLFRVGTSALHLALAGLLIFSRPRDRAARWGALLLAQLGFAILLGVLGLRLAPDVSHAFRALPLPIGIAALLVMSISMIFPGGAFAFCASFPRPLSVGNRPWWVFLIGVAVTISVDLDWMWLPVFGDPARSMPEFLIAAGSAVGLFFLVWALYLLAYNYRRVESRNERRRLRIVALGFGLSLFADVAGLVLLMTTGPTKELLLRYWDGSVWQLLQFCFFTAAPICTAYAILRHRVFDIHVMIRLGLRYAAARGVLLSIVPAAGLILAIDVLTRRSQPMSDILAHRGLLYGALGVAALVLHAKRTAWMNALDRRFFRERYDAYHLLSEVAGDVRRSAAFDDAARLVIGRIDRALHPESAALMVRQPAELSFRSAAAVNAPIRSLPADTRLVALTRLLNKPLENPQSGTGWLCQQLPAAEVTLLRRARVEWLFPVLVGGAGPEAFLLLGPKRSEEPYSREDRMMLGAIAASLALLLERLAASSSSGFAECAECGTCYDSGSVRCETDDGRLIKSPYSRTLAGRYRLERRIGHGGMGDVYEATDTRLERRVAVKVVRPEWIMNADAAARFRREARAAAGFSHPHVVTIFDFGVADDNRTYLVMELLHGRSLRDELRERGSVEPARALEILRGVASAVATAHDRRLVHRDLKPENVFLDRSKGGEIAKVLDFGLVKPLDPVQTEHLTGTAAGTLVGTLAYMSPEQRAGEAPHESWDVWALTVMTFEMLSGVHPFTVVGNPRAGVHGDWHVASRVPAVTLHASIAAFFERALAIDRARRPASVRQFIADLDAVL